MNLLRTLLSSAAAAVTAAAASISGSLNSGCWEAAAAAAAAAPDPSLPDAANSRGESQVAQVSTAVPTRMLRKAVMVRTADLHLQVQS